MGSLYPCGGERVGQTNLNDAVPDYDSGDMSEVPVFATGADGTVRVFLRDIESALVAQIKAAPAVLGCVAWLTSGKILDALAEKKAVQIVVQKEDFLRPDIGADRASWRRWLRLKYDALHAPDRSELPDIAGQLSSHGDQGIEAVRCAGNYNRSKSPVSPRMHHKFALFCNTKLDAKYPDDVYEHLVPYAVWTGSFNFTKNATASRENALLLTDPAIVLAFTTEYAHVVAISEPLDWEYDWVAPEWRVGS